MFNIFKKTVTIFFIFGIIFIFWYIFFKINTINLNAYKKYSVDTYSVDTYHEYEKIIKEMNIKKIKTLDKAKKFIIQNNNVYGTFTAMFLAKKYILSNDLDKAFIQLNNGLQHAGEENLKSILKIRMAKIKIQKNEYQEAANILNSIKGVNWNNIVENMKGDIYIKKNNKKEAIKSWKKSKYFEESNASKELINMKILELR